MPPIRSQADTDQDQFSLEAALDTGRDTPTRQEFKRETDVNHILKSFGVGDPPRRLVSYGEADYDLDLHSGFIAVEAAQLAFRNLPAELRAKYRNEAGMLDAANRGEFAKDVAEFEAAKKRVTGSTGEASDGGAVPTPTPTPEA